MNLQAAFENRWLFFDLGNTLIDEQAAQADRIQQLVAVFPCHGYHFTPADIEKALYQASAEFADRIIVHAVATLTEQPLLAEVIVKAVRYHKELECPYPETAAMLAELSQIYRIGVIANQSAGTRARLEAYGLAPYLSLIVSSTEAQIAKPDLAIFYNALHQANCPPERAVMIGDRIDNDILPAKRHGMRTIRVLQGYARVQQPHCEEETADVTVPSIAEIPAVLI